MPFHSMRELAAATGYPERSIRAFIQRGVLSRPENRGKNTVYDEGYVVALRAIRKLRAEHRISRYAELAAWFAGKSPAEIEAFVTGVSAPPHVPTLPASPPLARAPLASPLPPAGDRWLHVGLIPGLVLLVRDGAPEIARRLAEEIWAKYATGEE